MTDHEVEEKEQNEVAGFIAKTFEILKEEQFEKIIFWAGSGTEFVIKDINKFQSIVLPRYFRHNKMNSFIRQLNMYGFHKSRADHTKCVFSHPAFLRGRDDLLIDIKRKIKIKALKTPQTPQKSPLPSLQRTEAKSSVKQSMDTGYQLRSKKQISFQELAAPSFAMEEGNKLPHNIMNLNVTVKMIPPSDVPDMRFQESQHSECVSIQERIDQEQPRKLSLRERGISKFDNPSCFFTSMRQ